MLNQSLNLERALRRSELRRVITDSVSELPVDERIQLLLDVVADMQVGQRSAPLVQPGAASPSEDVTGPEGSLTTRRQRVRDALASASKMTVGQLATAVYGTDSAVTRNRTRSLLALLKKKAEVRSAGRGLWKLAPTKPASPHP